MLAIDDIWTTTCVLSDRAAAPSTLRVPSTATSTIRRSVRPSERRTDGRFVADEQEYRVVSTPRLERFEVTRHDRRERVGIVVEGFERPAAVPRSVELGCRRCRRSESQIVRANPAP